MKALSHSLHLNHIHNTYYCLVKPTLVVNALSYLLHLDNIHNTYYCLVKPTLVVNALSHSLHLNGLSFVCDLMCISSPDAHPNTLKLNYYDEFFFKYYR